MPHADKGIVDDAQPLGNSPQAELDIAVTNAIGIVEALKLHEYFAADSQACAGHRQIIPVPLGRAKGTISPLGAAVKRMAAVAGQAHYQTGVLNGFVRPDQLAAHETHARPLQPTDKLLQPGW